MPRRGNHEGNIRERPDGVWEGSISFHTRRYYVRAATRAKVTRALNDLRLKHEVGELVPRLRMTVGIHFREWLAVEAKELKPKTLQEYDSVLRNYLDPAFGHVPLQRLTSAAVAMQFARWREERKVTGGTLLNVYRVLNRGMVVAKHWGRLGRNPLDGVEPPRAPRHRPDLWTVAESEQFLGSLELGTWDSTLLALLLGSGCRLGEALALRWEDMEGALLSISRSITHVNGKPVESEPKTRAGVRRLTLPDFTLAHLERWRTAQKEQRLQAGRQWVGGSRIVTVDAGEVPSHRRAYDAFKRRCRALELPTLRLHDLRHLHATLLLAQGIPVAAVAARLGHATPAVTMSVYSHALSEREPDAAAAIGRTLRASQPSR